jgi:hypothetical protein
MKRLHDSNRLGSYLDGEEFQIERVIVWVCIPPHGSRVGWLDRADRLFDEIWRAIPDVLFVARAASRAQIGDPRKTLDEASVAGDQSAVRGIWIDPVSGSADYDVAEGDDYDGKSVMVTRDLGGCFLLRSQQANPPAEGQDGTLSV